MRYGIYLSNYGEAISARSLAEFAAVAEAYGWDGFFIWDHILASRSRPLKLVDPWVALAAMAMSTERIRLGTSVTPVARRRPWVLARQTASLDHLSNGRLILSVGLGEPASTEFGTFQEDEDDRLRAEKLDEGLAILQGLWSGKKFSFQGKHYQIEPCTFQPACLQQPRIPVWVGGFWPRKPPFRRASRWDGAFPLKTGGGGIQPADIAAIRQFIDPLRDNPALYDMVMMGTSDADHPAQARKKIEPYAAAGLTWWLENFYLRRNSAEAILQRLRQGPPPPV